MLITDNHRLDVAKFVQVPNMGGIITPKFLVMHYTAMTNAQSVTNHFKNPASKVSAHLHLDRDGTWIQYVPFNQKAWHAGASHWAGHSDLNSCSIGIEICNYGETYGLTPDGSRVVARKNDLPEAMRSIDQWVNVPDGTRPVYWQKFTDAQFAALDEIVPLLVEQYKIREIVGHNDIAVPKGRKPDPGPLFPMAHYKHYADYGNSGSMGNYVATVNDLNVRGGPGVEFKILTTLNRGDTVKVLKQEGHWMLVQVDQTKGYVHSGFLLKS